MGSLITLLLEFWKTYSNYHFKLFCLHNYLSETLVRYMLDRRLPPSFHDALIMYPYILHLLVSVGYIWIV